jgi:hypothetical protein
MFIVHDYSSAAVGVLRLTENSTVVDICQATRSRYYLSEEYAKIQVSK